MKPMNAQEAVEVLKEAARAHEGGGACLSNSTFATDIRSALAALDGLHIYASRFKPGDKFWFVIPKFPGEWCVNDKALKFDVMFLDTLDRCFKTRSEAEQEAKRRNESSK